MPMMFMVFIVICDIGMLGSMGETASTVIIPMKPEQWARPLASMLTPNGTGCEENGFPRDHRTGTFAVIGAMLKFPMAVNCTIPPEFLASAEAGETVMLCIWRVDVLMEPPQEIVISRVAAITGKRKDAEDVLFEVVLVKGLRIDTSK